MLIVTIRTDQPEAEIGLYEDGKQLAYEVWPAHRELSVTIHRKLRDMLRSKHFTWNDIAGIVCFKGPGSFTGLRIGLSVANALAYGLTVPIAGTTGENWRERGIKKLQQGANGLPVVPDYGQEPHITQPKK